VTDLAHATWGHVVGDCIPQRGIIVVYVYSCWAMLPTIIRFGREDDGTPLGNAVTHFLARKQANSIRHKPSGGRGSRRAVESMRVPTSRLSGSFALPWAGFPSKNASQRCPMGCLVIACVDEPRVRSMPLANPGLWYFTPGVFRVQRHHGCLSKQSSHYLGRDCGKLALNSDLLRHLSSDGVSVM
jgi:hypothetical protein